MNEIGISAERGIIEALGEPDVYRPGVLIYNRDCLEALSQLPKGIVDLTVTSPPYNIGKEYESRRDVSEYLDWCASWIDQVHRVTSKAGAFWLNLGYFDLPNRAKAIPIPYLLWDRVPFFLQQEIVWHYGAGVAARKSFSPRNEKFLWYLKNAESYVFNLDDVRDPNVRYPNQKKNGKLKCNPLGKNPTDVWEFPKVTSGRDRASAERTDHPAQFPIAVIDRIVRACSNQGNIVLDPFLGSGTTAEVSISSGRLFLGFELEARYVAIAEKRIDAHMEWRRNVEAQAKLFPLKQDEQLASLNFG
jgi:adenine-specific DNA-methyltransferase